MVKQEQNYIQLNKKMIFLKYLEMLCSPHLNNVSFSKTLLGTAKNNSITETHRGKVNIRSTLSTYCSLIMARGTTTLISLTQPTVT